MDNLTDIYNNLSYLLYMRFIKAMDLLLETPRLLLRPLELSDAEALFELNKNPNF